MDTRSHAQRLQSYRSILAQLDENLTVQNRDSLVQLRHILQLRIAELEAARLALANRINTRPSNAGDNPLTAETSIA